MKTTLHLLLSFLLITTILGCEKKEDATPEFKPKCKLLSSTLTTDTLIWSLFVLQLDYTYNEQGRLLKVATPYQRESTELTYNSQIRLEEELWTFIAPDGYSRKEKWKTSYNSKNQVERQEHEILYSGTISFTKTSYFKHLYNSANERIETQYYIFYPDERLFFTYKFFYEDDKVSSLICYHATGEIYYKALIVYDDKNTPQPDLPLLATQPFSRIHPELSLAKHNITSYIETSADGSNIYEHESYNVTYTYNEHGYPTEAIKTYLDGEKETIVYTYDCKE